MLPRSSIDEAEAYELPSLRSPESDDGDEDTRDEAAKLLSPDVDHKSNNERVGNEAYGSRGAVGADEDEVVGKGSSVEALIERVSLGCHSTSYRSHGSTLIICIPRCMTPPPIGISLIHSLYHPQMIRRCRP